MREGRSGPAFANPRTHYACVTLGEKSVPKPGFLRGGGVVCDPLVVVSGGHGMLGSCLLAGDGWR